MRHTSLTSHPGGPSCAQLLSVPQKGARPSLPLLFLPWVFSSSLFSLFLAFLYAIFIPSSTPKAFSYLSKMAPIILLSKDPLESEMATHSSIIACRIPWTEEPGGLQSTGVQKRHNWAIERGKQPLSPSYFPYHNIYYIWLIFHLFAWLFCTIVGFTS